MDEQDRTDTIDNTEQTPESGPNFVMQDTPAGQSSEAVSYTHLDVYKRQVQSAWWTDDDTSLVNR